MQTKTHFKSGTKYVEKQYHIWFVLLSILGTEQVVPVAQLLVHENYGTTHVSLLVNILITSTLLKIILSLK